MHMYMYMYMYMYILIYCLYIHIYTHKANIVEHIPCKVNDLPESENCQAPSKSDGLHRSRHKSEDTTDKRRINKADTSERNSSLPALFGYRSVLHFHLFDMLLGSMRSHTPCISQL